MTEFRILILDCTPKDEPSEGRLVKEFFQMCKLHKPTRASSLYYKINWKKEFLSKLSTGKRYNIYTSPLTDHQKGKLESATEEHGSQNQKK